MKYVLIFFYCGLCFGQEQIPKNYFSNPLDIPLLLSGNFGELRSGHFHSGLDIKTQQREGLPVYAPAQGVITRIKVSHNGYGKALYMTHPNGYITVYAHLQKYGDSIEAYVKEKQYQQESFEIELYPKATKLKVKKGDIIGYTGNTGSSGGPHLHFEIRDSNSRPMNPMLFGIDIPDNRKPLLNSIMVYPLANGAHVNQNANPIKLRLIPQENGSFKTEKLFACGKIGFGVSAYDQQNNASNKNGLYKIETHLNGENTFNITFDKFSFAETRYMNQYMDYNHWKTNKSRVQKLFIEPNNPLSLFKDVINRGYIHVEDGFSSIYSIIISDFKGNTVKVHIPIEGKQLPIEIKKEITQTSDYVYAQQSSSIKKGKFSIFIPKRSLYQDTYLNIEAVGDTLKFDKDTIPIHKYINISFDASTYKQTDLDKLFIAKLNKKGKPSYYKTYRKEHTLSIRTRLFGDYVLFMDSETPSIRPQNFKDQQWISNNKTLKIKIKDTLSGVKNFRATINGKWILMEYNYKKGVLTYDFEDDIIPEVKNNLKLIVVDKVGNSTKFEATFFRKQS